ncbi:UDP-glucose 4-epimerase [Haladaptatus sp. R4]|uniref:NAD-dependent epimerase/dehydratase family protein n=1 Tax=Haladaptatus sp. R4 TaxID=1679489 RepID=UPI0007B4D00A|nr:NAD(P)-dependent oxidoreductase [Haladaptatus sp. R4]KZN25243.1 UDP-glucose 4-epimerase [Haladaptatus sp. R4]
MTGTVVLAGSLDRSGRWLATHLAEQGWDVTCMSLSRSEWELGGYRGLSFRSADLTEQVETAEAISTENPDAVVHWASLPSPERHAGMRIFENNVVGAYNVLTAAGRANARIAWASNESAYGFQLAGKPSLPEYLPLDEEHPLRPEDPYGTSKVVGEQIGAMVARRYDVPVASIRGSWVQFPDEYDCLDARTNLATGAGNFWSYVDVRDVSTAIERAISADFSGHEPFIVSAEDNYLDEPIERALSEFFHDVPDSCTISGTDSALSTAKAQSMLGWEPTHSWRDTVDDDEFVFQ